MKKSFLFLSFLFLFASQTKSQTTVAIAKQAISSVVSIVANDKNNQPMSLGSAVIVGVNLVVTNFHCIENASTAYVIKNGETTKLNVEGYVSMNQNHDLVILKISGLNGTPILMADNLTPQVGEKIYAVGNPEGFSGTFTEGLVSGIREIESMTVIQISAPISHGSSGGAVINEQGQLIGISFASYADGQNLNFAIPCSYVKDLLKENSQSIPLSKIILPPNSNKDLSNTNTSGIVFRHFMGYKNSIAFTSETLEQLKKIKGPFNLISFSIKNQTQDVIGYIKYRVIIYDATGTIVDYYDKIYNKYGLADENIDPGMAKTLKYSFLENDNNLGVCCYVPIESGNSVEVRFLDYSI